MSVAASISTERPGARVAVIGAGPGGLAAARFLRLRGFAPVLVEAHDDLGGQWNSANPRSGVWPEMRTNTARMVTRFSDSDYPAGTAVFPRNAEVCAYLRAYAERFDLLRGARFLTRLDRIEQIDGGFRLHLSGPEGAQVEDVPKVVIATGRYNAPEIPPIPGLDGFSGRGGAIHAFHYKQPEAYRGLRVLIAGGNISALEIASDLAMLGAAQVGTAMRRQRYVMPKLIAGTPVESYGFTRAAALWRESASEDQIDAETLAFVRRFGGEPARYGAPPADPDIRKAGTTGSQNFLNLVAEDRIRCHPWIAGVDGRRVTFTDGTSADYDAIIFGTGYRLHLPFLSPALAARLEVDRHDLTLAHLTSHPDVPGLGFVGLWSQIGPYLPVLEQQARYLAHLWAGDVAAPGQGALDAARAARGQDLFQHVMAIRFARLAGADPEGRVSPALARLLAETAVTAMTFRLTGPDALPEAEATIRAEALRFGRPEIAELLP